MQVSVQGQAALFLLCALLGGSMGLLYDGLRLLRRMIPHRRMLVQAEDGIYWMTVAVLVFAVLLRQNHGQIHLFLLLGIFGGMGLYGLTLSRLVMAVGEGVLRLVKRLLLLLLTIVLTPFRLLCLPFRRPAAKIAAFCAKQRKKYLQLCKVYVKIKAGTLRRDIRFLRRKP